MASRKVFSDQQLARYRRVFNMCDRNKNGVLEGRELAAMAHVMGYGFDKEQVMVHVHRCMRYTYSRLFTNYFKDTQNNASLSTISVCVFVRQQLHVLFISTDPF